MAEEKKKESTLEKLWNKTIFPGMIKDKKEERELLRALKKEARKEALKELASDGTLKDQIKKKQLDKMTGKKGKDMLDKLAKGFGYDPNDPNKKEISFAERVGKNLGFDSSSGSGSGSNSFEDKIKHGFGIGQKDESNKSEKETAEEKVLRMMR